MSNQVLVIEGDGIGAEIIGQARQVMIAAAKKEGLELTLTEGMLGGRAYDAYGSRIQKIPSKKRWRRMPFCSVLWEVLSGMGCLAICAQSRGC